MIVTDIKFDPKFGQHSGMLDFISDEAGLLAPPTNSVYVGMSNFDHAVNGFSPSHTAEGFVDYDSSPDSPYAIFWRENSAVQNYGVADSLEQIEAHVQSLKFHPKLWAISAVEVVKVHQPKNGGWRWHKWGTYIGTKDPRCEYLSDEGPEIESVWCFHVTEVHSRKWDRFENSGIIGKVPVVVKWERSGHNHFRPAACRIIGGTEIDLNDVEAERDFGISMDEFAKDYWGIVSNHYKASKSTAERA